MPQAFSSLDACRRSESGDNCHDPGQCADPHSVATITHRDNSRSAGRAGPWRGDACCRDPSRFRCLPRQRRVLPEHLVVELSQRRARFDAQLLVQHRAELAVRRQRVRLPTRSVQREDPLGMEALAQGMVGDERAQLGEDTQMVPQVELGLDAGLERRPPVAPPGGPGQAPRSRSPRGRRARPPARA